MEIFRVESMKETTKYPVKYFYFLIAIVIGVMFFINSCKTIADPDIKDTNETKDTQVKISGALVDAITGDALVFASVKIIYSSGVQIVQSDSKGKFSSQFALDSSQTLTIVISKIGYISDTSNVYVKSGTTVSLSTIKLTPTSQPFTGSGPAGSIYLLSQSTTRLGVKGSGDLENGNLIFQVVDSLGRNLSYNHAVTVQFILAASPGGGEFLTPDSTMTDSSGRAQCSLTSGTIAGIVQIIAKITLGTKTIISTPVSYTIHGGLPDLAHFSVAPELLNFPGYNYFGLKNTITAFVGDKYSNPVRTGTIVYFSSTGGIIGGSAVTQIDGTASVDLMSASPLPVHPTLGAGFATITAKTADENFNTISANTLVLFSGLPYITVTPSSFIIPDGGSQLFNYTVSDQNGNPLTSGTKIKVEITGEGILTSGDLDITLPDTQSKAWTFFSFSISDIADTLGTKKINVKISSEGNNGKAGLQFSGIAQ